MKVSILTIGDEILNGTTIDTNAVFMAENLISEGIDVSKMLTVSDTEDEIVNALDFLKTTAEVIFITGGLGPTKDDITVKTLAKYVGQDLVFNEENYNHVNMLLSQRRKKDIEVDKSRCMFPEKTIFLNNQKGTAPGMWLEKNGVILISMPGVPLEMKQIFIDEALPKIKEIFKNKVMYTGREITSEKIKLVIKSNIGKNICLMISGDPALFSGQFQKHLCLDEHIKWFNKYKYNYEVIPGLSSLSILCAKQSIDLTSFSSNQNVVITSIERLRDLQQLNYNELRATLSSKPSLALYQSINEFDNIKQILLEFYPSKTKIIFAQSLSWNNEYIFETDLTALDNTDSKVNQFNDQTLILVCPTKIADPQ
mgnify:CR=1 FL=1